MAFNVSTNVQAIFIDSRTRPGTVLLPSTFTVPGRTLIFKDQFASFSTNFTTLATNNANQTIDSAITSTINTNALGWQSMIAGNNNKWYTVGGTFINYINTSTLNATALSSIRLSTGNVFLSTLTFDDQTFPSTQQLYVQSTFLYYSFGNQSTIISGTRQSFGGLFTPIRAPFFPNQISGLQLWLDAADVNTVRIQNGIVRQWNDKSGNSRNLGTVLSNAGTITYSQYGGVPSILINSTYTQNLNGAYMRVVSPVNLTNLTVFTVVRSRTAANNQNGLLAVPASGFEYSSTDAFGHFIDSATPQERFYANGTGTPVTNGVVSSGGDAYPLRISAFTCTSAGVLSSWGNGTAGQTTSGTARSGTATGFGLGFDINMPAGTPVNLTCTSQFSESIVYNVVLTTLQRQQVEGYLAWKWGLVALLPSTHPYKNAPP